MEKLVKLPNCFEILGVPYSQLSNNYTARPLLDYFPTQANISSPKVSIAAIEKIQQTANFLPVKTTTWFERNWIWILLVIILIGAAIILYYEFDDSEIQIVSEKISNKEQKTT
jgi:hypothetical protein